MSLVKLWTIVIGRKSIGHLAPTFFGNNKNIVQFGQALAIGVDEGVDCHHYIFKDHRSGRIVESAGES
jgi:hypothetical protein